MRRRRIPPMPAAPGMGGPDRRTGLPRRPAPPPLRGMPIRRIRAPATPPQRRRGKILPDIRCSALLPLRIKRQVSARPASDGRWPTPPRRQWRRTGRTAPIPRRCGPPDKRSAPRRIFPPLVQRRVAKGQIDRKGQHGGGGKAQSCLKIEEYQRTGHSAQQRPSALHPAACGGHGCHAPWAVQSGGVGRAEQKCAHAPPCKASPRVAFSPCGWPFHSFTLPMPCVQGGLIRPIVRETARIFRREMKGPCSLWKNLT